jgi:hypothetical protein
LPLRRQAGRCNIVRPGWPGPAGWRSGESKGCGQGHAGFGGHVLDGLPGRGVAGQFPFDGQAVAAGPLAGVINELLQVLVAVLDPDRVIPQPHSADQVTSFSPSSGNQNRDSPTSSTWGWRGAGRAGLPEYETSPAAVVSAATTAPCLARTRRCCRSARRRALPALVVHLLFCRTLLS